MALRFCVAVRPALLAVLAPACAFAVTFAPAASAQSASGEGGPAATEPPPAPRPRADTVDPATSVFQGVERPWLYSADATAPPPGHVLASMGVGYAQLDRGAARPFAADIAHAGAVFSAGAEAGVFRFASLHAEGLLAGDGAKVSAGAMAGVTFYPLPIKSPVDVGISTGYLRELGGANGIWGRVAVAGDLGPVRLQLTALGEHVFSPGRDSIDLLVSTGASYRIASFLRLGAEYVVQDLEGAWEAEEEEADGGIRHFVSPTLSLELGRRVRLTGGPAFGLSPGSPGVLGRVAAGYSF
jgi:hypothetical protein